MLLRFHEIFLQFLYTPFNIELFCENMNKRINATSVRISPYYSRRKANLTIGKCNVETIRSIDSCPIKLKVQYNAMQKFWEIYTHHSGLPISNTSKTLCSHTIKVTFEYEYWLF